MKRLATGLSDQQIADELFLSLNTVKWYNRQIYSFKEKLIEQAHIVAEQEGLPVWTQDEAGPYQARPYPVLRITPN